MSKGKFTSTAYDWDKETVNILNAVNTHRLDGDGNLLAYTTDESGGIIIISSWDLVSIKEAWELGEPSKYEVIVNVEGTIEKYICTDLIFIEP